MINKLIESNYKSGKVIKTFSDFGGYLNESDYEGKYANQTHDYDASEVKRKIGQAILFLSINRGFYGELLMHLNVYGSSTVETMCTNGTDVVFGPYFVLDHTPQQLAWVLAHEILHCIGDHQGRRGSRHPRKWNIAADYAINPILYDDDLLKYPTHNGKFSGLYDPRFIGMRAEDIYDILEKEGWGPIMGEYGSKVSETSGEVLDEDTEMPEADPDLVVQDVSLSDEEESGDEDSDWDDEDTDSEDEEDTDSEDEEDTDWDDEDTDSEEDTEDEEDDEEEEDGEEEVEDPEPPMIPEPGMYVKKRSGGYGKVTSVNADGTYDVVTVTEEEVEAALESDGPEY
jgi:hypothetical protein